MAKEKVEYKNLTKEQKEKVCEKRRLASVIKSIDKMLVNKEKLTLYKITITADGYKDFYETGKTMEEAQIALAKRLIREKSDLFPLDDYAPKDDTKVSV